ncbi:Rieske (2Fe-2S) protein [Streptomyces sp. E11-3]|uniref:Rieske (2Fe-2S) protein n=1 Tax=Streptomyces sp. E11-3 TaxID=3110112 RepID=UPI003980F405
MTAVQEPTPTHPSPTPSRRVVVAAVGAAGLAAALAACGSSDDDSGSSGDGADQTTQPGGDATKREEDTGGSGGGAVLAQTADIPEGGGTVFKDQKVVVTQPTAGEFKAFSSTCTHQGCTVKDVAGGTINCPCHGSKFDQADGSVKNGPATRPLPAAQITVEGDSIRLA